MEPRNERVNENGRERKKARAKKEVTQEPDSVKSMLNVPTVRVCSWIVQSVQPL